MIHELFLYYAGEATYKYNINMISNSWNLCNPIIAHIKTYSKLYPYFFDNGNGKDWQFDRNF